MGWVSLQCARSAHAVQTLCPETLHGHDQPLFPTTSSQNMLSACRLSFLTIVTVGGKAMVEQFHVSARGCKHTGTLSTEGGNNPIQNALHSRRCHVFVCPFGLSFAPDHPLCQRISP